MKTVKIKTKNIWKANQKNILPYVGEVQYDNEASIEVDENVVEQLLEYSDEFYLEGEEDLKKKSEDQEELQKSKGDDIKPQTEDQVTELSESDLKKELQKLSVKQLKEEYLSHFPEDQTKALTNKEQYINFIISNLVDA